LRLRHGLLIVKGAGTIRITSIACSDNDVRIAGNGDPNVRFTIQASSDLIHWENIGGSVADASGEFVFEAVEASSPGYRFFRASLP